MTCEIFGIINVTPDSFSDGGEYLSSQSALSRAFEFIKNGASFVDIGGESTRPDAATIFPEEEWGRVERVITTLLKDEFLCDKISLDTRNPYTAEQFFHLGGKILNDVSGIHNHKMQDLAAEFADKVVVGHWPGDTLAEVHEQNISSTLQVRDELLTRREELLRAGISADKIILDPNIGFGKTIDCNWELLKFAELVPDCDVMIGHSRKRFLGKDRFDIQPNLDAAQIVIDSGARYLRVHDVRETVELLR